MDNSKEFQLMLDKAIKSGPLAFKNFDRTKNVQDQLQEMADCEMWEMSAFPPNPREGFHPFEMLCYLDDGEGVINAEGESLEQLWLAFDMKYLYNKVWDGDKWI